VIREKSHYTIFTVGSMREKSHDTLFTIDSMEPMVKIVQWDFCLINEQTREQASLQYQSVVS
jgi:hypothetical protein